MKKILKYILLPSFLLIFFNFLEYGFTWNKWNQIIYPVVLTSITMLVFLRSKIRQIVLILSLSLLVVMALVYLFGQVRLANLVGNFGFALLIIVSISYLPDMLKTGYIDL